MGQAGHPNNHIGLGQGFIKAEDPPAPEFGLQVNQRLLLPGHQQELLHPRALAQPAANRTADVTGGANDGHGGLAQVNP